VQVIKPTLLLTIAMAAFSVMQCGNHTPPEYRRLFALPVQQQALEFKKYPLDQQLDIYVHAIEDVEPPATQFGTFLAANGKKVIPLLLNKLKEEKSDRRRFYLIAVFYQMHTEHCSLKDEREVVETISAVIREMKDSTYRGLCEVYLKAIREQPGAGPPC